MACRSFTIAEGPSPYIIHPGLRRSGCSESASGTAIGGEQAAASRGLENPTGWYFTGSPNGIRSRPVGHGAMSVGM